MMENACRHRNERRESPLTSEVEELDLIRVRAIVISMLIYVYNVNNFTKGNCNTLSINSLALTFTKMEQ
jgi:hypothetical protein